MINSNSILNKSILIPRRSKDVRLKFHRASIYKKIKQYIKGGCRGDLKLDYAPIEYLPDELKKVEGYLDLSYTHIKRLPDGLQVNLWLNLGYSKIESVPNELRITGRIFLAQTPLDKKYTADQIKQMIIDKGGSVYEIFIIRYI